MKKTFLYIAFALATFAGLRAQVPQMIKYQAVVRNPSGAPIANRAVSFMMTVQLPPVEVYQEVHGVTTNEFGLANLEIGNGTPLIGTFIGIDWSLSGYQLEVKLDTNGASNFVTMGVAPFASVPYALYAANSGGGNGWSLMGNAGTTPGTNFLGTTDSQPLMIKVNNADAGMLDASSGNTFWGPQTGNGSISGIYNTGIGFQAGMAITSGNYNTALGKSALAGNTTGGYNVALGHDALTSSVSGDYNTAIGNSAMITSTTAHRNVAIGHDAFTTMTTGSYCTGLGDQATVSTGALTNATALGSQATVNASNKVRLGNASVTVIEGQVAYSFPSDARFKTNVVTDVPGLDFIRLLRPVTYHFDTRKYDLHLMQNLSPEEQEKRIAANDYMASTAITHTGFLAQDIEAACQSLGYDFDGLHVPEAGNPSDHYSVAYSQFIMPLVKAVQEQQAEIEALQAENSTLKGTVDQLNVLNAKTAALEAQLRSLMEASGAKVAVE